MANYRLADLVTGEVVSELEHLHPLQQQLLCNRDIKTLAEADRFLTPLYEEELHDPFLLNDMDIAVERILKAVAEQDQIVIFSDYDCDGIPGAVVLHDFFKQIGYDNFSNYIPHRHYEGFGLSVEAVEKLAVEGAKLIITIDCGTASVEAVEKANELGMDVIVTDHHEPGPQLPEAIAVVNPKIGDTYPFPELCGAGVIFKLVQALIEKGEFTLVPGYEKWWLDMVGIATIADMVPLVGENRTLAHYGLAVLRKSRRPGLQHLLRKQRVDQRQLTEEDIGFTIGPRINAASRMDNPEDAFTLLATKDEREAGARADHLERLNQERKTIVANMTKEVHKRMTEMTTMPEVIVLGNPEWRPSLVGLTANKLAEEFKRPAFIWGRDGNGTLKGSCRSDGRVSVVSLMDSVNDHFIEHGGHHFSGGFSVKEESIHTFPTVLNEAMQALGEAALIDESVVIDAELSVSEIDSELVKAQQQLAPFGIGNPRPVYKFKNTEIVKVEQFGKGKEHLKLILASDGLIREAIAFFRRAEDYPKVPESGDAVTLIAHLEQSYFMNRLQTRLRIVDII